MEGGDQERIVSMAVWHAPDRPAPWKVHSWRSVPKLSLTGTDARLACCVDRPVSSCPGPAQATVISILF